MEEDELIYECVRALQPDAYATAIMLYIERWYALSFPLAVISLSLERMTSLGILTKYYRDRPWWGRVQPIAHYRIAGPFVPAASVALPDAQLQEAV